MIKKFSGLFASDFSKSVLTLISGVALAQIIPFLLSPILARIYTPEDFGEYAIYNSIVGVLVIISTARFEYAIALPRENINAFRIVKLILIISIIISSLSFLIFIFLNEFISKLFNAPQIAGLLIFIPITILFVGIFQSLTFWYNRKKNYRLQALSKLTSSVSQSTFSLLLGILKSGSIGLIISYIIGQIIGLIPLISKLGKREYAVLRKIETDELTILAKRYKKFPTYMTIGSLVNSISSMIPILMITGYFSTAIVGAMSFAQTVIVVPTGLIAVAFADVLRQRAVEDYNNTGSCRPLLVRTTKKLFSIGIIPFTILFFTAPMIFTVLFGSEWRMAGEFAQIMTFMFFMRFVFMSVSGTVIIVSEKLEYDIFWQVGYLCSVFLAIFLGNHFFGDIKVVLIFLSIVSSFFYLIAFVMAYMFSVKKLNYEA